MYNKKNKKNDPLPKILGLTASPIKDLNKGGSPDLIRHKLL